MYVHVHRYTLTHFRVIGKLITTIKKGALLMLEDVDGRCLLCCFTLTKLPLFQFNFTNNPCHPCQGFGCKSAWQGWQRSAVHKCQQLRWCYNHLRWACAYRAPASPIINNTWQHWELGGVKKICLNQTLNVAVHLSCYALFALDWPHGPFIKARKAWLWCFVADDPCHPCHPYHPWQPLVNTK